MAAQSVDHHHLVGAIRRLLKAASWAMARANNAMPAVTKPRSGPSEQSKDPSTVTLPTVFVSDLRHFLDMPDDAPAPAGRMAAHLVRIVEAGTASPSGEPTRTSVPCTRRPGRRRCVGLIELVRLDVPPSIKWWCLVWRRRRCRERLGEFAVRPAWVLARGAAPAHRGQGPGCPVRMPQRQSGGESVASSASSIRANREVTSSRRFLRTCRVSRIPSSFRDKSPVSLIRWDATRLSYICVTEKIPPETSNRR